MPSLCSGLSTNIDKLLSLRDPICNKKLHFISIPTRPSSNNSNDNSWIDLAALYKGEVIPFRLPDSNTLVDRLNLLPSEKLKIFFVGGIEVYLPVVSQEGRPVKVTVTPTNTYNKLHEFSRTTYSISPVTPLQMTYTEGVGVSCRQSTITNPYNKCGQKSRTAMPEICPFSLGTDVWGSKDRLYPSIYTQFNIHIEGYEMAKLDTPVTNVPIKIGLKYCTVDSTNTVRKGSHIFSAPPSAGNCCPTEQQFYDEVTKQCRTCPTGSKSFYNGLFCGELIKIVVSQNISTEFTYAKAVSTCRECGSDIASPTLLTEARKLGSKSCQCGWVKGSIIDSLSSRQECPANRTCPSPGNVKLVHCSTRFT